METAKHLFREGGIGADGFYRGLTAILGRNGLWNMVYFGLYHSVKQKYPPPKVRSFGSR